MSESGSTTTLPDVSVLTAKGVRQADDNLGSLDPALHSHSIRRGKGSRLKATRT